MSTGQRETVIVVHGTWAAPAEGETRWWQPPPAQAAAPASFARKLDQALERRGSPARCWGHSAPGHAPFSWSGDNDWLDRTRASSNLLAYLRDLDAQGIRYHLVGHSHGGNAIADTLPGLDPNTSNLGRVVTLGTPFLDTHGPIQARKRRRERLVSVLAKVFMAVLAANLLAQLFVPLIAPAQRELVDGVIMLAIMALATAFGIWLNRRGLAAERAVADANDKAEPVGLAITSQYDEVRQVLHHLRETANPLAMERARLVPHLWRTLRTTVEQKAEISRIHGASSFNELSLGLRGLLIFFYAVIAFGPALALLANPVEERGNIFTFIAVISLTLVLSNLFYVILVSAFAGPAFYSAFLAPFRWIGHRLSSVGALPNEIATLIVRRKAWGVLQTYATGLHGYEYDLPRIAILPKIDGPWRFLSAELDPDATARAMRRRGDWLHRRLGDVSQALTALTLTATDLQVLLRDISQDVTLVHAAYYTDDACIEQIADWIGHGDARSDRQSPGSGAPVHVAIS